MHRKIFLLLIFLLAACPLIPAFAETIKLKTGQEVEGAILERTAEYVKIDFMGVPLTYFMDEIDSINEENISGKGPESAQDYFYRGVLFAKKEKFDEAITDFSKAIELDPGLAQAYYNRGLGFIRKNNFSFAIDDFNKAIELKPDYAEAYNNRAVAFYMEKEFSLALKDIQKAQGLGFKASPKFIERIKKAQEKK